MVPQPGQLFAQAAYLAVLLATHAVELSSKAVQLTILGVSQRTQLVPQAHQLRVLRLEGRRRVPCFASRGLGARQLIAQSGQLFGQPPYLAVQLATYAVQLATERVEFAVLCLVQSLQLVAQGGQLTVLGLERLGGLTRFTGCGLGARQLVAQPGQLLLKPTDLAILVALEALQLLAEAVGLAPGGGQLDVLLSHTAGGVARFVGGPTSGLVEFGPQTVQLAVLSRQRLTLLVLTLAHPVQLFAQLGQLVLQATDFVTARVQFLGGAARLLQLPTEVVELAPEGVALAFEV